MKFKRRRKFDNKLFGSTMRFYRNKKNVSQIDAEMTASMSAGSMSKMELGKITPGIESILKLLDLYNLGGLESAYLAGIDTYDDVGELFKLFNKLYEIDDFEEMLQTAVDELVEILGLINVAILLIDEEDKKLIPQVISNTSFSDMVMKAIGRPLNTHFLEIKEYAYRQLLVAPIYRDDFFYSKKLSEFVFPSLSKRQASMIQKASKQSSSVAYRLSSFEMTIGSILYSTDKKLPWKPMLPMLRSLSMSMGILIQKKKEELGYKVNLQDYIIEEKWSE